MKTVRSQWANTILVCSKCTKKLHGGFGPKGRTSLAKALREDLGVRKGRKGALGIAEVKCLKVCPKGAVVMVDGAHPHDWLLVREGAGMDEVVASLDLAALAAPPAPSEG